MKELDPDDWRRVVEFGRAMEEADRRELGARAEFLSLRDRASMRAWESVLREQLAAHGRYWSVAIHFVEKHGE